jgi:hypothetical protein
VKYGLFLYLLIFPVKSRYICNFPTLPVEFPQYSG